MNDQNTYEKAIQCAVLTCKEGAGYYDRRDCCIIASALIIADAINNLADAIKAKEGTE
jgi:hypothetical protein